MTGRSHMSETISSKAARIDSVFDALQKLAPARSGLEAYSQLCSAINHVEDAVWGAEYWAPPRTFTPGDHTDRIYPVSAESFFTMDEYPGVTLLVSTRELIHISRDGAIEIHRKPGSSCNATINGSPAKAVIFEKTDACGHGVWHSKNRI